MVVETNVTSDTAIPVPDTGLTPSQVGRLLRVAPDRVRAWIRSGELKAINTAPTACGKPRFVVLPSHLEEFTRRRQVVTQPPPSPRRKRQPEVIDFYPD